jgi:hypothetical protein
MAPELLLVLGAVVSIAGIIVIALAWMIERRDDEKYPSPVPLSIYHSAPYNRRMRAGIVFVVVGGCIVLIGLVRLLVR